MSKSIIYKDEARKKVFEGVDKLAKTVSVKRLKWWRVYESVLSLIYRAEF